MYKTFTMSGNPRKEIIPFPFIWDLLPPSNVILPPFFGSKVLKREWSIVICLEHALSRYNKEVSITLRQYAS